MSTTTLLLALQEPAVGGTLAVITSVSAIVIAVAIVALAVMGGILFVRFNVIMTELRRSARQNFGPVSDRARSISDNVEFVTQALRTDVENLNSSVRALSDRLQQASDRMEERIEEFNALMEVVQGEAEELFLDTASTVRGVREGARAIAEPRDRSRTGIQRRGAGEVAVTGEPLEEKHVPSDDGARVDDATLVDDERERRVSSGQD